MIPDDAGGSANEFDVKTNLETNAMRRRKYSEMEVGDKVRELPKTKNKERKGWATSKKEPRR